MRINHIYTLLFIFTFFSCKFLPVTPTEKQLPLPKVDLGFVISENNFTTPIYTSVNDYAGVLKVAKIFQNDIGMVTGTKPKLNTNQFPKSGDAIIIGTIGKSDLIDKLIAENKIDVSSIEGKWETYLIVTVENPINEVKEALVIIGSDKRGTIYGMFDISKRIGVSPWYYWADVPVKKKNNLYFPNGSYTKGTPKVKYRGIFINNESPSLSGWAYENFGGFNANFYEHVFELLLRLKGNYLWPSMQGREFYLDDPKNSLLANEYGIIMGTSIKELMTRAPSEVERFGIGDYQRNSEKIKKFWKDGLNRSVGTEKIITIGLTDNLKRSKTNKESEILFKKVIKEQRNIIAEVTGKPIPKTPQLLEYSNAIQNYNANGLEIPEDIILLLKDDNWGNLTYLPLIDSIQHKGGYGIYYHFDFVGEPGSYNWINSNPITRIWEQLNLAYEHKASKLWIVNVGNIKPLEFPIDFFMEFAWNPNNIDKEDLQKFTVDWAKTQFGDEHAIAIAEIISDYTKYNARRKPELLASNVYSLINYREAENVVSEFNDLLVRAEEINRLLDSKYRNAFYQLVLHSVAASANLNEMYITVAKNKMYADQERNLTNKLAVRVEELFEKDSMISLFYNKTMANGKWNHIMNQVHIGVNSKQQYYNVIPKLFNLELKEMGVMGVAVEGSKHSFPNDLNIQAVLPEFDEQNNQKYYVDVFNKGKTEFNYSIQSNKDWVFIEQKGLNLIDEHRNIISIDWLKAPKGSNEFELLIEGPNESRVIVKGKTYNINNNIIGFVENNDIISIEAANFSNNITNSGIGWVEIPDLGKTRSAMTPFPVTASKQIPINNSPHLEYKIHLRSAGEIKIKTFMSPTMNYHSRINNGLTYAISIDDQEAIIVNIHEDDSNKNWWKNAVSNSIINSISQHNVTAGNHTLKIWMVDAGIVLQKIVIETGNNKIKSSYLGPPQSIYMD